MENVCPRVLILLRAPGELYDCMKRCSLYFISKITYVRHIGNIDDIDDMYDC